MRLTQEQQQELKLSINDICRLLNVSKYVLNKYLKEDKNLSPLKKQVIAINLAKLVKKRSGQLFFYKIGARGRHNRPTVTSRENRNFPSWA